MDMEWQFRVTDSSTNAVNYSVFHSSWDNSSVIRLDRSLSSSLLLCGISSSNLAETWESSPNCGKATQSDRQSLDSNSQPSGWWASTQQNHNTLKCGIYFHYWFGWVTLFLKTDSRNIVISPSGKMVTQSYREFSIYAKPMKRTGQEDNYQPTWSPSKKRVFKNPGISWGSWSHPLACENLQP